MDQRISFGVMGAGVIGNATYLGLRSAATSAFVWDKYCESPNTRQEVIDQDVVVAQGDVGVLVGLEVEGCGDPGIEPALDLQILDGDVADVLLEMATQDNGSPEITVRVRDRGSFNGAVTG